MDTRRRIKFLIPFIVLFGYSFSLYASNPDEELDTTTVELPLSFSVKSAMTSKQFISFCRENPSLIYQDIFIEGKTEFQGINLCSNRYDLIKPILDSYQERRFSILDLGAAQGYFSFRIAKEYPEAECAMIEHSNTEYDLHDRMLFQLCHLNRLPNITFLHRPISIPLLSNLANDEHFDIVLAFLVVHQIASSMDERKTALESLLNLSDHLILELSNDVAPELRDYVKEELSRNEAYDCSFLGEVERYYDPATAYNGLYPNGKGEFYWVRKKNFDAIPKFTSPRIKPSTFLEMNGIYPSLN